jgi:hypothetical protein
MALLPGSNPLFGLNTLGGALVLRSKSGDTDPGGEVEVQGGSFGRRSVDLSYGQKVGEHGHVFGAFSGFDEDGWRDFSPRGCGSSSSRAASARPTSAGT